MADQKISQLVAATAAAAADLLSIVQGGTNKKLTFANLFNNIDGDVALSGVLSLKGTPQTLTASGAVSLTTAITLFTPAASLAATLADATKEGQIKVLVQTNATANTVVTPTTPSGFATLTFNAAGDTATLIWTNSKWNILSVNSVAIA